MHNAYTLLQWQERTCIWKALLSYCHIRTDGLWVRRQVLCALPWGHGCRQALAEQCYRWEEVSVDSKIKPLRFNFYPVLRALGTWGTNMSPLVCCELLLFINKSNKITRWLICKNWKITTVYTRELSEPGVSYDKHLKRCSECIQLQE